MQIEKNKRGILKTEPWGTPTRRGQEAERPGKEIWKEQPARWEESQASVWRSGSQGKKVYQERGGVPLSQKLLTGHRTCVLKVTTKLSNMKAAGNPNKNNFDGEIREQSLTGGYKRKRGQKMQTAQGSKETGSWLAWKMKLRGFFKMWKITACLNADGNHPLKRRSLGLEKRGRIAKIVSPGRQEGMAARAPVK